MTNPIRALLRKGISVLNNAYATAADYARDGFYSLAGRAGDFGRSYSGEAVTTRSALSHSVVWACVRRISGSSGSVPCSMMQEINGEKNYAGSHPAHKALHNAPNAEMGSMEFRETLTGHVLLRGNAFAQILRRSGTGEAIELWPLSPENVTIDREKENQRRLVYVVKDGNAPAKTYTVVRNKPQDIFHLRGLGYDGMRGYDVLQMARNSIGNAQAVERYAGRHFATGGRQPGFIEVSQRFKTVEELKKFKDDINAWVQNPSRSHEWPVFEPGQTFKPGTFTPEQSQFLGTRQWTPSELCRWFEMSPHMAGDLTHATFSNVEHLGQDYVTFCLMNWIRRWEDALWRCVLTPDEQSAGYYFKFNLNSLMRGDFISRMGGYASGLQNGVFCIDNVCDLEDMNHLPNGLGKDHRVQLNMQVIGQAPPALTAAEKQLVMADQIQQLLALVSSSRKETIQ
jgi:HK97 family phage portal protein